MTANTIWLQIFMKQHFCEFQSNHEHFCHEFQETVYNTGLDSSKSREINESRNHARSRKYKTTKIWSYTVVLSFEVHI